MALHIDLKKFFKDFVDIIYISRLTSSHERLGPHKVGWVRLSDPPKEAWDHSRPKRSYFREVI